jgi:hypothetical protein
MTPEQEQTILDFLEELKDQVEENGNRVVINYVDLCAALEAFGKYDRSGYKLSETKKATA